MKAGENTLYQVWFYRDKSGREPVKEYFESLARRSDKDSRIKLNKIRDYVKILCEYGTRAGEPYVKHLAGEIWELRPARDRVLFAAWNKNGFVLLHQFTKQTRKTPAREIKKAKQNLKDYLERSADK